MEKIELTREQIEKIAEGISVICFRSNSEAKKFLLMEYPKVKDVFGNSCIWDEPVYNEEHPKEVKSVLPSFEAVHTFGSSALFKPTLAEIIQACPINLLGNFNAVTIHYNQMNLIFTILDNIYRTKMLIQVFLRNFIHRTLKQCLKITGIG